MWFLFAAIGVALSWVVAYGWGLAKGAELTRRAQARLHDGLRGAIEIALAAHARERAARQTLELAAQASLTSQHDAPRAANDSTADRSLLGEASRAAELASAQTLDALARLSAALGEDAPLGSRAEPRASTLREEAAHEQTPRSVSPTRDERSSET